MNKHIQHITYKNVDIKILRLDILQPEIQGNKYYKLKYNLLEAKKQEKTTLLTFGGEYSNHIHATALAGKKYDFKTIGIIRGDKPSTETCTIKEVQENAMQVYYLNRTDFRTARKLVNSSEIEDFYSILEKNNILINKTETFIIPEGGTNKLALKGTAEILNSIATSEYNTVCVAIGTAGTIAGIIGSIEPNKKVIGFPALKGNFFEKDISNLLMDFSEEPFTNWQLKHDYHFKGFGAFNDDLISFINSFYTTYKIPLCTLYTGKMFYGIFDMIDKGELTNIDKTLAIHTGGLQGRAAFNEKNGGLLQLD